MKAGNRETDSNPEVSNDLYQQVIKDFKKTGSVEKTARNCHLARVTAQKILITEGLWSSKTSIKVAELLQQGRTVKEIAQELFVTEKTVQTYTPYTRGKYGVETEDAQYSQDYRERMQTAAANMHQKSSGETIGENSGDPAAVSNAAIYNHNEEEDNMTGVNEDSISTESQSVSEESQKENAQEWAAMMKREFEAEELKKPYTDDESWTILQFSDEELRRYEMDPTALWSQKKMDDLTSPADIRSYRLRLELIPDARWDKDLEDCLGGEEHKKRFLQLAKAERGITRDVVVPGDMNLHSLHYVIQQAFGWQNSHLHRYCLPEEGFNRLTAGRVGGYMDLCGILFRCNSEDSDDLYWDDDYKPEQSVKTWIRRKYSRPFRHYAVTDTRYQAEDYKKWLRKRHPEITDDMRVSILNREHFGDLFCDDLMEGLLVEEIFRPDGCDAWDNSETRKWKEYVITEASYQDDDFMDEMADAFEEERAFSVSDWETDDDYDEDREIKDSIDNMIRELKAARKSRNIVERYIWQDKQSGTNEGHKYIEEQVGCSAEEALESYEYQVLRMEHRLSVLFDIYVVHPLPFTNELLYQYDFGDDWWVKITLAGIEDTDIEKAKCIAADGLNLVDDCGGISGYYDFLQAVYGTDPEERESMKQWGRGLGWTGRKKKPENIL